MPASLEAIFFDVGNTLLFPTRSTILAPLYRRNLIPTLDHWHAVERATKQKFDGMQKDGRADHGFWFMFYTQLLGELNVNDEAIRDSLLDATRISANWSDIRPRTRESLQRLGRKYCLGIISNADGKIADVLARCGIADRFASITDSGVVGYEKPHPAIFQEALGALGAKPEQSLYVGDVYSVDYAGAAAAGMQAVLFDVCGAYRDMDLPRVESLEELGSVLRP